MNREARRGPWRWSAAPIKSAAATIVDFAGSHADPYGGFSFDPARIVNGNCLSAGGCLALNDNETTGMARTAVPSYFTLSGFSFNLLGRGTDNSLTVTGSNGRSLSFAVSDFAKNTYHSVFFSDEFKNVSSDHLLDRGRRQCADRRSRACASPGSGRGLAAADGCMLLLPLKRSVADGHERELSAPRTSPHPSHTKHSPE